MKQIMTYHCSSMALMTLANNQSIQLISIQDNQLNCTLASLLNGHPDSIQECLPIDHSFMIFSGFTLTEMDTFLKIIKQRNIRCDYKAMITTYNANWSVQALVKELSKEQKQFKK